MKTNTETLAELFAQIGYDFQVICDEFADAQGKPTGTIDEYLKPKEMKALLDSLENLKHTAIDVFELNVIDKSIEMIKNNNLDRLLIEIDHEIKNYQHYVNYIFFTQLKKTILNNK